MADQTPSKPDDRRPSDQPTPRREDGLDRSNVAPFPPPRPRSPAAPPEEPPPHAA